MTPKSFAIQGGTLAVRNGKKYWIQAGARQVSEAQKELHSVDEAMNYTAIFIYDYESGEIINSVFNIPFGHGNDLEYNPDLDKIIICSALEEGETITEVSWDLTEYTCFSPDGTKGFRTVDCAYDSTDRVYVITIAPLNSNYLKDSVFVLHYDENWQLQNKMKSSFSIPENHYGFQGACIYKGYYYLVNFLKDNLQEAGNTSFKYARISIYDCDTMSYVGSFPVNVSDEIEDITIIGHTAYLNGQLYKDGALKYHIYEIDLEKLNFVPNQEETTTIVSETTTTVNEATTTVSETTMIVSKTTTTVNETTMIVSKTTTTINETTMIVSKTTTTINETTIITTTKVSASQITNDIFHEETELPETGNHSLNMVAIVTAAFTLILIGTFMILRFEIIHRCKEKK